MLQNIYDYLFKNPVHTEPKKLWFFYWNPYGRGLAGTLSLGVIALAIILLIFIVGVFLWGVVGLWGCLLFVLYWAALLGIVVLGGWLGVASENGWGFLIGLAIAIAISIAIFGGTWDDSVWPYIDRMFSLAARLFDDFNKWDETYDFVVANYLVLGGVIILPAASVGTIALLSLATFLTLRGSELAYLRYYGVRRPCPECSKPSEPAKYFCPNCGQEHEPKLIPSVYGVFHHACHHCGHRLPTQMVKRKGKSPRHQCRHCSTELNDVVGTDKHMAFVGGRRAGKTTLLAQLTSLLMQDGKVALPEARQQKDWENMDQRLQKGDILDQTQNQTGIRAFQCTITTKKNRPPYHLYMYDVAGENYEHVFDTTKHPFFQNIEALNFLLDPLSVPVFKRKFPEITSHQHQKKHPEVVFNNMKQGLEKYLTPAQIKKIRFNIILVKADWGYLDHRFDTSAPLEDQQEALRAFLTQELELANLLLSAEQVFSNQTLYYVSALGREANPTSREAFTSQYVDSTFTHIFKGLGIPYQVKE